MPLAFLFATIGVLFVSYAFVRLSRYFSHAGSVYAFSGITLGPRAGFFAGWALLGTYVCVLRARRPPRPARSGSRSSWSSTSSGGFDYVWIALVAAALIALLAYGDIRVATRSLLGMEGISVTLIVILDGRDRRQAASPAPRPATVVTADAFKLPSGTSLSAVASAAVFGFLSFGGFEGAAALGEETDNPRSEIPRAIRNAVLGCGIFYILCIPVQTWGFGTNAAGVKAFSTSGAPLGDLARSYVGSGWRTRSTSARRSARSPAASAATAAGARILFALSRDTAVGARSAARRRARARRPARWPWCWRSASP